MSEVSNSQDESLLYINSIKNDLYSYCAVLTPNFVHSDFAKAVCWAIQEGLEGRRDRIILQAPPRHGKSMLTSELAPAWFLGKNPRKKIIAASHTAELASDMGLKVKSNMEHPIHKDAFGVPGCVNHKKTASDNFLTNAGGQYYAVGVGGSPIGKGADVYIVDDPIRSRKDVDSESKRQDLKNWYSTAVLSRLEGQGTIIVMHQRWHEDDLAGYLVKEFPEEKWLVINLPAMIETEEDYNSDFLDRDYGEVLIPELHNYDKLQRLRATMIQRDWNSMYQQRPRKTEGEEFTDDMLMDYTTPPMHVATHCNRYIIVDPANSKKKTSDYTCMAVIGLAADNNFYILDLVRERLNLTERANKLIELHQKWDPMFVYYEQYGVQADIQHIEYVQEQLQYRFQIIAVGQSNSASIKKEDRILRLTPDMKQGRWYKPVDLVKKDNEGKTYKPIDLLIKEEMVPFPEGKHDDALDALSRIYDCSLNWPKRTVGGGAIRKGNKVSPW